MTLREGARIGILSFAGGVAFAGTIMWLGEKTEPKPIAPPHVQATPYRVFRIGGERVGPWTVCGERAAYEASAKWGPEGQVCVFVMKDNVMRAIACGTQMFVADTGQPCN